MNPISVDFFFSKVYIMDDSLDFTDDEIREELSKLGYSSVPDTKLEEFKKGTFVFELPHTKTMLQ